MRDCELATRASRSKLDDIERSTTDSVYIKVDTTDGFPSTD